MLGEQQLLVMFKLWQMVVSKHVLVFHIISGAVPSGPFQLLLFSPFLLIQFHLHRFVWASEKCIHLRGLLLRPVISGENDEMLISFFLNVCNCADQGFLEAIITDSFGVAPPVVRELRFRCSFFSTWNYCG